MKQIELRKTWKKAVDRFIKLPLPKRRAVVGSVAVGALAIIYLAYLLLFFNRVYPNVSVGSVEFGGLKRSEIPARLAAAVASHDQWPVQLHYDDSSSSVSPGDVSWRMDMDATSDRIYQVGRDQNYLTSFWAHLRAPLSRIRPEPVVSYDAELLDSQLTSVTETIDEPAVDATANFIGDKLVVTHEKVGKTINRAEVAAAILANWANLRGGEVTLEAKFDAPEIVIGNEDNLKAAVSTLQGTKLTLKWDSTAKPLDRSEMSQLIGFVGSTGSEGDQQTLRAEFTTDRAKAYLTALATTSINQPAKDPKLVIKDGVLAIAQASSSGRVVDIEVSASTVIAALGNTETDKVAELTLKAQEPIIKESNLAELGIKERIGIGETSFAGSPANRIHNIRNGVSLMQSALIKPGAEFSTVGTLGRVDDTTGFLPELVIKENKTTPEFGGGLCQVSTTLFRSVMNAGLKVTERQNHSYRVSYYEPPVGLDATIYLPKPDFKFLNDTPGHILVQGKVAGNKVVFELWGTSDGRTSTISEPQILSTTPAGDPEYADTDTLFKGEQKQIEKAHDGAVTIATYTVMRGGQVINKQTFKSVYKRWPAKILVGTKEPPAPTP